MAYRQAEAYEKIWLLLKERGESVLKILGGILTLAGVLVILATAGASDFDMISFSQILWRSFIGLLLMLGGFGIWHIFAS